MLGIVIWVIIILAISVCVAPWWFLPALIVVSLFAQLLNNKTVLTIKLQEI